MSSALLSRSAARAVSVSAPLLQTTARRHASAKFAHLKVKKLNWVEQNEILRENQFYQWTLNKKNTLGVLIMTVGFPVFFYQLYKDEQIRRDEKYKGIEGGRQYM